MAYIEHYGIPRRSGRYPWGSGDRPYQGSEPKAKAVKAKIDKALTPSIKQGKDKPSISPAEKVLKETSKINDSSKELIKRKEEIRRRKTKREDLSQYTNEELQKKIQRMNLERQYSTLTDNDINPGYQKTMDVLDTFGDVLAIAASAVGIAVGINQLTKK